jgi:hypothetical protein
MLSVRSPSDTAFRQQRMKAWQPLLTPGPVIIAFLVIGIVFVPLGVILLITSNNVHHATETNTNQEKRKETFVCALKILYLISLNYSC